jgi:hypothetical protein
MSFAPDHVYEPLLDGLSSLSLLRDYGVPLAEARQATEHVLQGEVVTIHVRQGADIRALARELDRLGVVL